MHGVKGYRIGGKTGTSEDGVNTGKYVTSFIGVATISNPEVCILVTLYNPTGEGGHQGGGVAAPIGSQLFKEILPYLDAKKDGQKEDEIQKKIIVENLIGKSIKEAEEILNTSNLLLDYKNKDELDKNNTTITKQIPEAGIEINEGNKVYIEY